MKKIFFVAIIASLFSFANGESYDGPTFEISAWRGETVYSRLQDRYIQEAAKVHGSSRDGVAIALGRLHAVPYINREHTNLINYDNSQMSSRLDCLKMFAIGEKIARRDLVDIVARVDVSRDTKPGVYEFGPLKIRVVDREFPVAKDRKYFLDLWQHPWAVARYFDAKPFSKKHYDAMKPVWKALAEGGQKALTVTLLDLPWNHQCYDGYQSMIGRVKKSDGSWNFDYSLFDEYIQFGRECGIGPDIACYTMCPWGYIVRWKNEKGETERIEAKPGTKEFEEYWGDFLVDFAKHLKEKGWFEDTYIAMDERSPEDVQNIANFIQEKAPGMKIAMAGNRKPSDFKGIKIDNYSQYLSDLTPEFLKELDDRRAAGCKTTFYVCCFPLQPNTFMRSPDNEGYWIGAYPALVGFDGFLRWAANSWPCDPYRDASCDAWLPGDTFFIYPNGELSARFIALRAGIIAAEKIRILKAEGLVAKEVEEFAKKYNYKEALSGKMDMNDFRREFEELVNK